MASKVEVVEGSPLVWSQEGNTTLEKDEDYLAPDFKVRIVSFVISPWGGFWLISMGRKVIDGYGLVLCVVGELNLPPLHLISNIRKSTLCGYRRKCAGKDMLNNIFHSAPSRNILRVQERILGSLGSPRVVMLGTIWECK